MMYCCCFVFGVVLFVVGVLRFNYVVFDFFDEVEVVGYEVILVDCFILGVIDNEEENCVFFLWFSWEIVFMVLFLIFDKFCYYEVC